MSSTYQSLTHTEPFNLTTIFHCSREPGLASCPIYLLPFVPKENLWDNNGTSFQRSDTHDLTNSIKALKETGSTDFNHGKSFGTNQLLGY